MMPEFVAAKNAGWLGWVWFATYHDDTLTVRAASSSSSAHRRWGEYA
jgi:hypothetical protein